MTTVPLTNTPQARRAFLLTWNQLVLAIEQRDSIAYEDWSALWEQYGLESVRLTAWGH